MTCTPEKRAFFNEHAADWDSSSPPPVDRVRAVVAFASLREGASVLDAGCGTGILIPHVLEVVGEKGLIYAVDPAEEMLAKIETKVFGPRVLLRRETLESCALEDHSCEGVICFQCFPHFDDPAKAVRNATRILKPGGRLVVAHVSSRAEMNEFHSGIGGAVGRDRLPPLSVMASFFEAASLRVDHYADRPGRYEVVGVKSA